MKISKVIPETSSSTITAPDVPSCVWLSTAYVDLSLSFGFVCELDEQNSKEAVAELRRFKSGTLFDPNDLPALMWIDFMFQKDDKRKLPPLFSAGGFLTVSEEFAGVLRRFDLGRTRLHPVELLHYNRKDRFPGQYYLLNIAEVHQHFSPDHSQHFEPLHNSRTYIASTEAETVDDDIAVLPSALQGPDLWIDNTIITDFFCSDRLARALRAAKLARRLSLYRCKVAPLG